MRILVTGVNGFVGGHLASELSGRGHAVVGLGREAKPKSHLDGLLDSYVQSDLTVPADVRSLNINDIEAIINLAGLAQVGASFAEPKKYKQVNVEVLRLLGQRVSRAKRNIRLLAISTGAVYDSNQSLPLTEKSKVISDGSPYAISKLMMEDEASKLRRQGLDCIIARPFNHIGPGQEPGFLVPDLYDNIKLAVKTKLPLKVGNLKTRRDYTDVRDVVRAYAGLVECNSLSYKIYNVCSSKSLSGEQILDLLARAMDAHVKVEVDKSIVRKNDPIELYGSYDHLSKDTGWSPEIKIQKTIEDFVRSKA